MSANWARKSYLQKIWIWFFPALLKSTVLINQLLRKKTETSQTSPRTLTKQLVLTLSLLLLMWEKELPEDQELDMSFRQIFSNQYKYLLLLKCEKFTTVRKSMKTKLLVETLGLNLPRDATRWALSVGKRMQKEDTSMGDKETPNRGKEHAAFCTTGN